MSEEANSSKKRSSSTLPETPTSTKTPRSTPRAAAEVAQVAIRGSTRAAEVALPIAKTITETSGKVLSYAAVGGGVAVGALWLAGAKLYFGDSASLAQDAVAHGGLVACTMTGAAVATATRAGFALAHHGLSFAQWATLKSLGATDATVQTFLDVADVGAIQVVLGKNGAEALQAIQKIISAEVSRREGAHDAPRTGPVGIVPMGVSLLGYVALQQVVGRTRLEEATASRVQPIAAASELDWAWMARLLRLSTAVYGRLGTVAGTHGPASVVSQVTGLTRSHSNHALDYADLTEEDLVASNWYNTDVFSPAYMVVADRDNGVVVVVMRGTGSATDCLTDLHCSPCDVTGHHSGMLEAATRLSSVLLPVVQEALETVSREGPGGPGGARLLLTGHSLGAGVSTLLAWTWRDTFPPGVMRCFAFAPPATMNVAESLEVRPLVTSVVVGDDVVPSWSLGSSRHLIDAAASFDVSSCKTTVATAVSVAALGAVGIQGDTATAEQVEWCRQHHATLLAARSDRGVLVPAGTVVWLPRDAQGVGDAVFTSPNAFADISFSPRMLTDHLFKAYEDAVSTLARQSSR